MLRGKNIHFIELLSALGAVLQHSAHCGITVNICVFALDITVTGGLEGKVLVYFHKACVHFTNTGAIRTVENICLCGFGMAAFHQYFFNSILYFLNGRRNVACLLLLLKHFAYFFRKLHSRFIVVSAYCAGCFIYSVRNLVDAEGHGSAITLLYFCNHNYLNSFQEFRDDDTIYCVNLSNNIYYIAIYIICQYVRQTIQKKS